MCDSSEDSSSGAVSSLLCLTRKIIASPDLSPSPVMSSTMKEEISDGTSKNSEGATSKQNQVGNVMLFGVPIVSLVMDAKERLCLAQISSTLLKDFSYNEIHNRRVALGINCVQCTPVQLEILRRAGAMPVTSRRCGMITRREAERLCKSFLGDHAPPQLPENFAFDVYHECGWGCRGSFVPSRYNSSRAKCIKCCFCQLFFSPNKFIFHSHRLPESRYVQPDAANFNSWRRHMKLCGDPPEEANSSNSISDLATAQIVHAWEDVKAMFNGGTRKRLLAASTAPSSKGSSRHSSSTSSAHNHHGSGGGGGNGSAPSSSAAKANSCKSHHGEHQNPGGSGHSRNQSKKEMGAASSSVSSSTAAPTQPPHPAPAGYNQEASFLQQSPQHAFLNVNIGNPLLSPTGRLDAIWNPALQGSRPCQIPGSPSFPALPFHPLSIPWLRRPLFPFSHPFGPTLLNDPANPEGGGGGGGGTPTEKLANLAAVARQNQSAFKPVSRSVEPLFNWLNGNGFGGLPHPPLPTLPEDLSLHSPVNATPGANPSTAGTNNGTSGHFNANNNLVTAYATGSGPPPVGENKWHHSNRNHNNNKQQHQIQILTSPQTESDDEENVDIESTVETEECSSTSSVWVSSTTLHNINNNKTVYVGGSSRSRKRSLAAVPASPPPCYSSGEDEMDGEREEDSSQSDNQDDYTDTKISSQSSSSPRESKSVSGSGGKRKRLWVNEIISTTDEDEEGARQQVMMVNSLDKGKGGKIQKTHPHHHHHHHHHNPAHNSASRVLLETRE